MKSLWINVTEYVQETWAKFAYQKIQNIDKSNLVSYQHYLGNFSKIVS